eukprot:7053110-Ditylum_brightwellii.AAC.2
MQTWYICQALIKPYRTSLQTFIAQVNKINDWLEQFLPRDNGTPQFKLADSKLMDILKNTMPKFWKAEMHRQHFNCTAKGQANFIQFCKNLELLEPLKQAQKGGTAPMSSTGTNQKNPRRKWGREADVSSLSTSQVQKKATKYCLLHSNDIQQTSVRP